MRLGLGIGLGFPQQRGRIAPTVPGVLAANPGNFTLSGINAALIYGRLPLVAAPGSFTLAGQAANLFVSTSGGALLTASPGSFVITGDSMSTFFDYVMLAEFGSFDITGKDAQSAIGNRRIIADVGNFAISGKAVASGPQVSFIGTVTPTNAGTTSTATGAAIGTASADREVVVIVTNSFSNITTVTATIDSGGGAVAMTRHAGTENNGASCIIFSANVASGTTATIVATRAGGSGWGNTLMQIFTITKLASRTPTDKQAAVTSAGLSQSVNLATSADGCIIAGVCAQAHTVTSFAGSTETFVGDNINVESSHASGHAQNISANAASVVQGNVSLSDWVAVCAVAWR